MKHVVFISLLVKPDIDLKCKWNQGIFDNVNGIRAELLRTKDVNQSILYIVIETKA